MKQLFFLAGFFVLTLQGAFAQSNPGATSPGISNPNNPIVPGQSTIPGAPGSSGPIVPGQSTGVGGAGTNSAITPGKSTVPGNPTQ